MNGEVDVCPFTACPRPSAAYSRAGACAAHEAELQAEWQRLMRRTQHHCEIHPLDDQAGLWDESDE